MAVKAPVLFIKAAFAAAAILTLGAAPTATAEKYASIVIDLERDEVLHARHADAPRYPASLTKAMTLYMLFDAMKAGEVRLHESLPVSRAAAKLGMDMSADGAREIAGRARGTPRVAGRLLRRVRDLSEHAGHARVDAAAADAALRRLGVDDIGLDKQDMRYLHALCDMFGGGPTGADTLAAALSEARDALEDVIEPYLIQQGFLQRTPRGRMLAQKAWRHLGLDAPKGQGDLGL
mgnify:CR=1 FL=1